MTTREKLIKHYEDAEKKLIEIIRQKVSKGSAAMYQRSLLKQVKEELNRLSKNTSAVTDSLVRGSYRDGLTDLVQELKEFGFPPDEQNIAELMMSGLNRSQIRIIVENTCYDFNKAINLVGRRIEDSIREAAIEATAEKLTTGQTIRQMQKNLENKLQEQHLTCVPYANGAMMPLKAYAEMSARSTTAETQNIAKTAQGQEWGYDLVRMTTHSPTCAVCAMYQGRVYATTKEAANGKYRLKDGTVLRFPYLYDTAFASGYSTIHPNCRHRIAVFPVRAYTDKELRHYSRISSAPFEDMRSDEERKAYSAAVAKRRQFLENRRQFEKIKTALPDEAPKSFSGFMSMKRSNSERYQNLMRDYRHIRRMTRESGISSKNVTANSVNTVDLEYISSKEYRDKFKNITNNHKVNEQLYNQSKAILTHRNGTDKEDFCLIDGQTGAIAARQSNSKVDFGVEYNSSIENAIRDYPRGTLISIHNHPTNNPPTGSDLVANGSNGYKLGIVVTHNGKVFLYKAGEKPFTVAGFGKEVDKYRAFGYTEYDAIINVLTDFSVKYGIEWSER